MLNWKLDINNRFVGNIYNDIVDIINDNEDLNKEVHGDILRIVVFVEDKDYNFTSFSLETKDL